MTQHKPKEMIDKALDSLVEALDQGQSTAIEQYLQTMSRFYNYSLHNVFLIAVQKPQATRVAGFHAWRKFGRFVKKGEKGIAIVAPLVHKKDNPDNERPQNDAYTLTGFKVVYVFDVSQTDGQDLPAPSFVHGDSSSYLPKLDQLILDNGIALEYSDSLHGDGCSQGGKILIRNGLPQAHEFSVKVHELAHEFLHHSAEKISKMQVETEAEAIAYVVCNSIGLDTNTAASDYILLYQGDKETLVNSLTRIKETSGRILEGLKLDTKSVPS